MYQKRPVNTYAELLATRPGSTFTIADYLSLPTENLPAIRNLAEAKQSINERLTGSSIVVYTDYDVDGVMSASIIIKMLAFMTRLYAKIYGKQPSAINLLVPDRMKDGYGFNAAAASNIHDSLILLLDNGTVQHSAIITAKANRNTVIVIDHHEPDETPCEADILVNPHAVTGGLFNEYCAAGLCYRVARAIMEEKDVIENTPAEILKEALDEFIFLAAVATIADVVPLLNENRMIVKNGLKKIPPSWRPFINYLCETDDERDHVWGDEIRYKVAPAINASGRLGELTANFILAMCLNKNGQRDTVAKHILRQNEKRRNLTDSGIKLINNAIDKHPQLLAHNAVIVQATVHAGVVGIIAGRLADKYQKPCFVFTKNEAGEFVGSARTKPGTVNLKQLLDEVNKKFPGVIVRHGGHELAAGITVDGNKFDTFTQAVYSIVDLLTYQTETDQYYDFEIRPTDDWFNVYNELEEYGPWGEGNPTPVFMVNVDMTSDKIKTRVFKETIRIMDADLHEYLGFGMKDDVEGKDNLNLYGTICRNEYHGGDRMQFTIDGIEDVSNQQMAIPV